MHFHVMIEDENVEVHNHMCRATQEHEKIVKKVFQQ